MNVDHRGESNACTVKSKYFTSKSDMDESLSDFQEPKQSSTGPKNTAKTKNSKPRKAPKRTRGQKDIRTVLRSKKNDLESYSEDFDKVCIKAGLDVDSEQLQLAIALSKSLQETASTSREPQALNTQERIGKIRTTLQEYGFKVPEIKIVTNKRKKKILKKKYKLILTSETEKNEIISNKYSQILFQDITHCSLYFSGVDLCYIPLYYLATHVTYDVLKKIDTFYVNNLIEKSSTKGNLLRDWSEIPGRPVSPKVFKPSNMNFSEIECSQDELDIVLSGTLKSCKNVLSNKNKVLLSDISKSCKLAMGGDVNNVNINKCIAVNEEFNIIDHNSTLKEDNNSTVVTVEPISTENTHRSCSPDLFDDDASSILDSSRSSTDINPDIQNTHTKTDSNVMDLPECVQHKTWACVKPSLNLNSDLTKRKSNDLMEITECLQCESKNNFMVMNKSGSLSQNSNVTKRKTNDLMEFTECVATHSQPIQDNNIDNIDLTQIPYIIEEKVTSEAALDQNDKHLEGCQAHSKPEALLKLISPSTASDIDLTESPENHDNTETNNKITNMPLETNLDKSIESIDLTQSSNTSDELPFVSLTAKDKCLDRTIIVNDDYADINKRKTNLQKEGDAHIDLTQVSNHSQSFFEEFDYDHSDNIEEPKESNCKSNEFSQNNKDHTQRPKSEHSNSHGETPRNHLEKNCSYSLSELNDMIRSNLEKATANYDLFEQSLPVEYHRCNIGFKPCKPGNVDLTQKSPERELRLKRQNRSMRSKDCNFGFKPAKPGKVDLTQSQEEEICTRKLKHSSKNNKSASSSVENSFSQHKSYNVDCCNSQERSSTNHKSSNVDRSRKEISHSNLGCKQNKPGNVNISISPIKPNDNELNDIGLAQNSDSSVELSQAFSYNVSKEIQIGLNVSTEFDEPTTSKNSQTCSLGKRDDVSIDYDDFISTEPTRLNGSKNSSSKSVIYEDPDGNVNKLSKNESFASNCSQNSEVFEISDKELDYSLHQSKLEIPGENFVFGGISIMDDLSNKKSLDCHTNYINNNIANDVPEIEIDNIPIAKNIKVNRCKEISPIKHKRVTEIATPQRTSGSMFTVVTPQNSELIIKTNNVTPMLDYKSMSTPEIHNELDKYGIKPFKRKRAIQLLTHIYNQTHPIIEDCTDELASPPKRHKPNEQPDISPRKQISPRKILKSSGEVPEFDTRQEYSNVPGTSRDNLINKIKGKENSKKGKGKRSKNSPEDKGNQVAIEIIETNYMEKSRSKDKVTEYSVSKEIECKPEDWVFQKREKTKVYSCRVPLHIAFHNYLMSRQDLREAILCYEPVEIDVIHKDLVAYGHRYDPKDLLKFLDKKCITVKTADNDARNNKR